MSPFCYICWQKKSLGTYMCKAQKEVDFEKHILCNHCRCELVPHKKLVPKVLTLCLLYFSLRSGRFKVQERLKVCHISPSYDIS